MRRQDQVSWIIGRGLAQGSLPYPGFDGVVAPLPFPSGAHQVGREG